MITFNYKEGEERLDFTDIESSDLQSVGGPIEASNLDASIGPSGETWTHGLLTPSQARYQLRHTRKCAARSQLSYNSILFLEMQPLKWKKLKK